jgi:integrase
MTRWPAPQDSWAPLPLSAVVRPSGRADSARRSEERSVALVARRREVDPLDVRFGSEAASRDASPIYPPRLLATSPTVIARRVRKHFVRGGDDRHVANQMAGALSGHSLRVGLAVAAAGAGADVRALASVTGHKSPQMVMRYTASADKVRSSPHRLEGGSVRAFTSVKGQ